MSLLTQTKILRVLQNQRFERVGGNETIQTDVRLLGATNRNLEQLVTDGKFRGDLYYRLNVMTIHLPPLRERLADLPLLVEHFLRRFSVELGKDVTHAAPEAIAILRAHAWPGNLRELQSVLKQALLQARGSILLPTFLPRSLGKESRLDDNPVAASTAAPASWERFIDERLRTGSRCLHAEWLELTERHLLTRVLNQTRGNQLQAAKVLGVSRNWLRSKIRALNILIERSVSSEAALQA
jgi:DNA-binding NtrC family response regulator